MKSFMGVPIRYENEPLGNLHFNEQDQELLRLLASHAAMAIRNARLHAAAEDERNRQQRRQLAHRGR
jgi:GAF domain-containing protein